MIVISDTSPLHYLVLLGHADLLPRFYGQVIVPPAVVLEMQQGKAPAQVRAWAADLPSWIQSREVRYRDETLPRTLGAGERDAISMAMELQPELLLIDERAGRHEAELRRISITGTLGILLRASMLRYLDLPTELVRLQQLGFRCSGQLKADLLTRDARAKSTHR